MTNLKAIEKRLKEAERQTQPVIISVWLVDDEAGTYEHNGIVYTKAECEAMTGADDTVIIIDRPSPDPFDTEEEE